MRESVNPLPILRGYLAVTIKQAGLLAQGLTLSYAFPDY
jgi:hypothetical protein